MKAVALRRERCYREDGNKPLCRERCYMSTIRALLRSNLFACY